MIIMITFLLPALYLISAGDKTDRERKRGYGKYTPTFLYCLPCDLFIDKANANLTGNYTI